MKLAGLKKTSLIDYPDLISAVVFTRGCNFKCGYCHNSQLINNKAEKENMPEEIFFDFLDKRQGLIDGVVISGGEPTLQPDLKNFIKKIKRKHNLKIKLDSNGSNQRTIAELIKEDLIDYLAVDIKQSWNKYSDLSSEKIVPELKKTFSLILNSNVNYEFRTTVVPGWHDKREIEKIAKIIQGADRYYIQNFKAVNTLDPKLKNRRSFSPAELKNFKKIAEKYLSVVRIRN
ncbi:anaerobic ribonucleoside-triphosphate reductase activating protein [Halanaerobium hydrogeniformans]|uniref:Anaerobic ribonucleoside-triphosphate reductase activating protein n=1 Tax=Halanaerobium hydrogeniformans TaxID=656519 RepID=E4RKD4_HALHG|nr:anaerobic ribonucleoside-triphosphate reductase activating protein [Halanaerobium hydrogeniformans]ADQ15647.1 anaerobic ribonucleoside-triphosphate reductase activating protein [Halanaerobium hydrogeniformans]